MARGLRAGMVHINDQTINDQHTAPMGGFGASGNGTRFGPQADLDEYTQWQWVTVRETPKWYPF
jgi:benzaldehyde dehydrogenase (NAD)